MFLLILRGGLLVFFDFAMQIPQSRPSKWSPSALWWNRQLRRRQWDGKQGSERLCDFAFRTCQLLSNYLLHFIYMYHIYNMNYKRWKTRKWILCISVFNVMAMQWLTMCSSWNSRKCFDIDAPGPPLWLSSRNNEHAAVQQNSNWK